MREVDISPELAMRLATLRRLSTLGHRWGAPRPGAPSDLEDGESGGRVDLAEAVHRAIGPDVDPQHLEGVEPITVKLV